jgi:Tfp pilus assembly protein PilF
MKTSSIVMAAAALILVGSGLLLFFARNREPDYFKFHFPIMETKNTLAEDIALYEKRTAADPDGALDPATLAELYVSQGKATGDTESFRKAEAAALHSLKNRKASNPGAELVLADIAQARHQFRKALQIVGDILQNRPGAGDVMPVLITSQLALGDLAEADLSSRQLLDQGDSANAQALRALVLEARGRDGEAEYHFTQALLHDELDNPQSASWNRAMLARFYLYHGNPAWARTLLNEALRITPRNSVAVALLAKLEEDTGNLSAAERSYRAAFEASKQVPFLLGEARVLLREKRTEGVGLRDQGEELLRADLEAAGGVGHRAELIRLLLDRRQGSDVSEALKLAQIEVEARPNSDSLQLLAWAEWKTGALAKAHEDINRALSSGVRKPEIFLHAALIERDLKNPALAKFYLTQAENLYPDSALAADLFANEPAPGATPKAIAAR